MNRKSLRLHKDNPVYGMHPNNRLVLGCSHNQRRELLRIVAFALEDRSKSNCVLTVLGYPYGQLVAGRPSR